MKQLIFFITLVIISISCSPINQSKKLQKKLNIALVDSEATFNSVALFYNLKKISHNKIIFGHHHSTAYGIGWMDEPNRSDVKDVTGSFPGLIGWDFADLTHDTPVKFGTLENLLTSANDKGLVNTFCWHAKNFVTDSSFYDTTIVVNRIIPGGDFHDVYVKQLDSIAQFTKHLVGKNGKVVPIIFRPYHEFDGNWFWWGKHFCTKDEFISLWRFTVDYLRNVRHVKNLLYAFSSDRNFYNEEEFLERYPGDNYVDIIGMDNYYDFVPGGDGMDAITKKLKIISELAEKKNKIAAFTETGSERISDEKWWTDKLLKVIDNDSVHIAYVMVWRNAHINHFYAPYKGHPSSQNFIEFKNNPKIIFSDTLPDLFNIDSSLSK
jgi:mannan endo-1,4-beta-mannosidase